MARYGKAWSGEVVSGLVRHGELRQGGNDVR